MKNTAIVIRKKKKQPKREAKEVTEILQTEQQARLGNGEKAEAVG